MWKVYTYKVLFTLPKLLPMSYVSLLDADFFNESIIISIRVDSYRNEISANFTLFDDNINEEEQTFARIALDAGIELDMAMICFVIAKDDTNCSDQGQGAALIRIKDNDSKLS